MLDNFKIIDLTQPLNDNVPNWSGSCGFCLKVRQDYDKKFKVNRLDMDAGIGTHMDAPSHLFKGGISIAEIPLSQLVKTMCVIDVSAKAHADYEISVEDIESFEKAYGIIPKGAVVVGYTGWSRFWDDVKAYRNQDSTGQMHFPAFSAKAVMLLIARDIAGIAIDTLSPDCSDLSFPVHNLILGNNKYIIENIGDCSKIPPKGAYIIAFPLKINDCTESPIRVAALISS